MKQQLLTHSMKNCAKVAVEKRGESRLSERESLDQAVWFSTISGN